MSPKKNHSPVKQGASVRRVTKPVEVLDEDDINLLISAPPTLKPKSQLPKRKATTAPSDSSEVEILEYPTPSKKKIRALSPAGLAKDLEVPSIASPRVASSANGPGNSGLNTFSRPKRIIKMTEKAQAQVADPVVQPPAVKPSARGQKKIDISALTTVPTPEISPSIKKESTPPIETAAGDLTEGVGSPKVRRKGRLLRIESDDELPEVSELFNASSPNLSDSTHQVSNPFIDDEANENSAEDPSESDQTGEGLAVWEQEAGSGDDELAVELASPMSVIDSDDENPEDPNAVMQKRFQNHILARSYENLPHLERYYAIAPYPSDNRSTCDDTYAFMDFSVVAKAMGRSDAENLVALINGFLTYSTFVYLPRADPDLLVLEGRKLKLAACPGPAICLMPGVVTESYLFKSLMIGRPGHEFPAHGLTIACFQQELRRESSIWGEKLKLDPVFCGNIGPCGISFVTLGEGKGFAHPQTNFRTAPSTPKRPTSSLVSSVKSPVAMRKSTAHVFPSLRNFEDQIPIYDGTTKGGHPFTFSNADLDKLQSWPLFNGGKGEVPLDAVVVIGYVASWYGQAETRYFAGNIIFAIVLNTPSKIVG